MLDVGIIDKMEKKSGSDCIIPVTREKSLLRYAPL